MSLKGDPAIRRVSVLTIVIGCKVLSAGQHVRMPRIFDNLDQPTEFGNALRATLEQSRRADFCVGYFNLRGWGLVSKIVGEWDGDDETCCRVLIGMNATPEEQLRAAVPGTGEEERVTNRVAERERKRIMLDFRRQLMVGTPRNQDEEALHRLIGQLRDGRVRVRLFTKHRLHAKLYLCFRNDQSNPRTGFVGSSNLTFSGLRGQGELNIDVMDHDATAKLASWFQDRWDDRLCLDVTEELVDIIEESWAGTEQPTPYQVYLKMAYHLSQDARAGSETFRIPRQFKDILLPHQTQAIQLAARHVNKRGGVLLGDVVGLGKTMMATALAALFEEDLGYSTLIICPPNLISMWQSYVDEYGLRAKIVSTGVVDRELVDVPARFRIVLIDESHSLRNRTGKKYEAIRRYIQESESRVILLSATPYNKTYLDLASQLRLFVTEDKDVGIRPEQLLREVGEARFLAKHQCPTRSIAAFEKSEYPDDWRELMRLYLVRRTRSFIQTNYTKHDPERNRQYLELPDGTRFHFPVRQPRNVEFRVGRGEPYSRLYGRSVVDAINSLTLPRYGLAEYLTDTAESDANTDQKVVIGNLSRAGQRLMGFCRTNLFKRLESSGHAFLQSIERHILRNYVTRHAVLTGQPIPIGTQDMTAFESPLETIDDHDVFNDVDQDTTTPDPPMREHTHEAFESRAEEIYNGVLTVGRSRFDWLPAEMIQPHLADDLLADADRLREILTKNLPWDADRDSKLDALHELVSQTHPDEKVLVFSQFADTVDYLVAGLRSRGVESIDGATGQSADPTRLAHRFSPRSNEKRKPESELRILIATDLLSEGQNLQDCRIVVNFDLPWAIVRLIQRAGRVDRIGQKADTILCYSFLPARGVESVIRLRQRVRGRLQENREVVGTDERFFEDEAADASTWNELFTEQSGVLDDPEDDDVDLASYAFEIWNRARKQTPELAEQVERLPDVVYSTKSTVGMPAASDGRSNPEGVLTYVRTADNVDALIRLDANGKIVTESQRAILDAARCEPETPTLPRLEKHHELVEEAVRKIDEENPHARSGLTGGQLGSPRSPRARTYQRLRQMTDENRRSLFDNPELRAAVDEIYRFPLYSTAEDTLRRQLRAKISDEALAELVLTLREDDALCNVRETPEHGHAQIICSLGLSDASS